MPHTSSEIVVIAGRVAAGMAGALAFYLAFFLYENEDGKWQNRLEDLWIAIDERARITQSKSTALLNKLGDTLLLIFDRVFGKPFSLKGCLASINLSGVGVSLILADGAIPSSPVLSYLLAFCCVGVFIAAAVLPAIYQGKRTLLFACLPLLSLLIWMQVDFGKDFSSTFVMILVGAFVMLFVITFNMIAIVVLKAIFGSMSQCNSTARVVGMIVGLTLLSIAVVTLMILGAAMFLPSIVLNSATMMEFVIPDLLLVLLLVHRVVWPTASRLIYPLIRFKIVTNRKALVSFGTLCLTYALNVSHVGLKEILKLFG